jgi:hypothetical protein
MIKSKKKPILFLFIFCPAWEQTQDLLVILIDSPHFTTEATAAPKEDETLERLRCLKVHTFL